MLSKTPAEEKKRGRVDKVEIGHVGQHLRAALTDRSRGNGGGDLFAGTAGFEEPVRASDVLGLNLSSIVGGTDSKEQPDVAKKRHDQVLSGVT